MQYHDSQKLSTAFRTDCQRLINRFELYDNVRFENFCEIWKDMLFSLVFMYHPTDIVLTEFCKDALCIAKQLLVNASSLKERIGALYLLYAIYYKMPVKNQLKIRMTLSDWKYLMELHTKIKEEGFLDANYILCKLIVNRAFVHCISDNEYGIEKYFVKKQEKPKLDINLMHLREIKDLMAPGQLLSTINKLSQVYEEKKRIVFGGDKESGLQLYNAIAASDIMKNIRSMQSENNTFADTEQASSSKALTSTSINEISQKSLKRKRIRKDRILSKIGRAFEDGLHSESDSSETE